MKAIKIFFNFIGIILALVLSLLLIVVLAVSPVVMAASDFVKPESIHKVITSVNYEKILVDSGIDLRQSMGEYGIPTQAVNEIMQSNAVKEVVDLYVKEIRSAINGESAEKLITADAIKQIASDNIGDLIDIALNNIPEADIPEDKPIEEIKQKIETTLIEYVNENAEAIVSYLPDVREVIVESVDTRVIEVVKYVQNGTFTVAIWTIIIILSVLIFACRWPRYKGFMWLAVSFFFGTLSTLGMSTVFNNSLISRLISLIPMGSEIIAPAMRVVSQSITKTSIIFALIMVALIAIFIVGRVSLAKKKKFAAAVAEAESVEEYDEEETVVEETALEETTEEQE